VSPAYPEDSVQSAISPTPWWTETDETVLRRGRLIRTFLPHISQEPRTLIPEGRSEPTQHERAVFQIEPLRVGQVPRQPGLPVAALPTYAGEVYIVQRAKVRPALVLGAGGPDLDVTLRRGTPRYQTAPTLLVAPYYGVDQSGSRSGYRPEFVIRIRRCEYPQYMWDKLPIRGSSESILRLDHVQPVGLHPNSFELLPYQLNGEAMDIVDTQLQWLLTGILPPETVLADIRNALQELG
jgi:hypothetical protein